MLERIREKRELQRKARHIASALSQAARRPAFFTKLAVPDTIDGRFEIVTLHGHLVLRHLARAGAQGQALGQAVFDVIFADIDVALRELGVSDMSIGRKIKEMAEAFYGRAAAYQAALTEGGDGLEAALARNVYRGAAPSPDQLRGLADYVRRLDGVLGETDARRLTEADIAWPVPEVSHGYAS